MQSNLRKDCSRANSSTATKGAANTQNPIDVAAIKVAAKGVVNIQKPMNVAAIAEAAKRAVSTQKPINVAAIAAATKGAVKTQKAINADAIVAIAAAPAAAKRVENMHEPINIAAITAAKGAVNMQKPINVATIAVATKCAAKISKPTNIAAITAAGKGAVNMQNPINVATITAAARRAANMEITIHERSLVAATAVAFTQEPINAVAMAEKLRKSVIKWNFEAKASGARGTSDEWKQHLKNFFTFLTRFQKPSTRVRSWRHDLQVAASQTIEKMCPNWPCDRQQLSKYQAIRKASMSSRCPTREWLNEKAYAWLKWLSHRPDRPKWYADHAVVVAYEIFLSGTRGKFSSFLKYLADKPLPEISAMAKAHPPGSKSVAYKY